MSVELCPHREPARWCRACSKPPGEVYWTDRHGETCGFCGHPICDGDLVVNLPAPAYGFPIGHATC